MASSVEAPVTGRPRVSVIIPVFNGMNYVGEAIESVLAQQGPAFELLLVDDGSSDGIDVFASGITDPRFRFIKQPRNLGAPAALNRGIRESRADLVCWLSHDDLFLPDKLRQQVLFMDAHPEFGASYTDSLYIDAAGRVTDTVRARWYPREEFPFRILTEGNLINGSTIMIRRWCFDQAGLFDESMKANADGEMWFRMLRYTPFGHLPEILVKYRWHPANQSHNLPAMRQYIRLGFARLLDTCPPEDLVPGTPHPPGRGDRARAHAVVARALEERWNQTRLAARHYAHSFLWRPSAPAGAGWLRTCCSTSRSVGYLNDARGYLQKGIRAQAIGLTVRGLLIDPFDKQLWRQLAIAGLPPSLVQRVRERHIAMAARKDKRSPAAVDPHS